jgi:hypothetical protein
LVIILLRPAIDHGPAGGGFARNVAFIRERRALAALGLSAV